MARAKMDLSQRAKIFLPFAALKGFEEALAEAECKHDFFQDLNDVTRTIEYDDYYENEEYIKEADVAEPLINPGSEWHE